MDDPKRYADTIGGLIEHEDGGLFRADDPAIVQALAVRKACHEAGLLDADGNLRKIVGKPVLTADGHLILHGGTVWRARRDSEDRVHYVHRFSTRVCTSYYSWGIDSEHDYADEALATAEMNDREAAERAAGEPSNGGTDGQ